MTMEPKLDCRCEYLRHWQSFLASGSASRQTAPGMKEPESLQQVRRTYVRYHGRELSYFTGCDYFRLASHPRILKAITTGLHKFGLNVAASRRTTGNHAVYVTLEKQLTQFFGAEAALLVNTGYLTNLTVAQTLAGNFSHALVDEKSHLSPADAAQFLNCPVLKFKHRDVENFAATLRRCGRGARPVVLTDGMFAGDGSVAPLRAYLKLLPRDGLLLVDDAHGAGTLGANGGGTVELEGVDRKRIVQCVTLSKAFGCYGGAILCSKKLRTQIVAHGSMFIGSTPLPLPLAHAASVALQMVKQDRTLRQRLNRNAEFVKRELRHAGMDLPDAPGPIIQFLLPSAAKNRRLRRALLAAGIYPSFINYPGAPAGGYFRFVISSEHTQAQLQQLVTVLKEFIP
jgi:7-keto-8-aminopelargonate synthetase-like enzyme